MNRYRRKWSCFERFGECRPMALSGHAASAIRSPLSVGKRILANVVHRPQFAAFHEAHSHVLIPKAEKKLSAAKREAAPPMASLQSSVAVPTFDHVYDYILIH
jgi:hypothetical protein